MDMQSIIGIKRFLDKVWRLYDKVSAGGASVTRRINAAKA